MNTPPKKRPPHRPRRTPLGTQAIHWTISREVVLALEQVIRESDQGETESKFVDAWLRQHPRVAAKLRSPLVSPDPSG